MPGTDDELGAGLAARLQTGDAKAFEQLVTCYERPMFNVAYRMLGDAAEAADATQDVFLKVFEHIDSFDPKYRLFSWIYRIAMNESLDRLKQRRPAHDVVDIPVEELPLAGDERGPVQRAHDGEMHNVIQTALRELSQDYRAVIVLRHFSGCSYAEMAVILGIPEKTVKSRLYSARQALAEKLRLKGVTAA
ncbi:MAG: RNA polymerase sigma factor [Rhodanobacteraceae bacterium]